MHVCSIPIKKQTSIHAHKIIIFKSFLISQVVAADYVYFSARCLCANPVGLQGTRHLGLANFQSSLLPLCKCHDQHTWPLGRCFYTNPNASFWDPGTLPLPTVSHVLCGQPPQVNKLMWVGFVFTTHAQAFLGHMHRILTLGDTSLVELSHRIERDQKT